VSQEGGGLSGFSRGCMVLRKLSHESGQKRARVADLRLLAQRKVNKCGDSLAEPLGTVIAHHHFGLRDDYPSSFDPEVKEEEKQS